MIKITSQTIPLDRLHPNNGQVAGLPKNPRVIRDAKFKKLKASIQEDPDMLQLREIIAYDNGGELVIIAGNMRYRAMKDLGLKEAPCKIIPQDTPLDFLKAVTLKDNSEFGEWDIDALCNEWDKALIDAAGIEIPDIPSDADEDEEAKDDNFDVAANTPKKPNARPGDIYQLGDHRIICGDSTKADTFEALMDGAVADLLVTDPPYNVDYQAKGKMKIANDHMAEGNFIAFLTDAFTNANEALKLGGVFYVWHADSHGLSFRTAAENVGWQVRQCLIWNKNSLVLGRQDYQWKHEPCLYGWKDGAAHYFITRRDLVTVLEQPVDLETMSKAEMKAILEKIFTGEVPTTVIDCEKPRKSEDHPTMKPVPLIGRLIRNSSRLGDIVLDCFGGSGTTLIAAEQLHRKCYMVEYEPAYIDVIIKRWEELTGSKARLVRRLDQPQEDEKLNTLQDAKPAREGKAAN